MENHGLQPERTKNELKLLPLKYQAAMLNCGRIVSMVHKVVVRGHREGRNI